MPPGLTVFNVPDQSKNCAGSEYPVYLAQSLVSGKPDTSLLLANKHWRSMAGLPVKCLGNHTRVRPFIGNRRLASVAVNNLDAW